MRQSGFEPPLTPLRYYALEERSGTDALTTLSVVLQPDNYLEMKNIKFTKNKHSTTVNAKSNRIG